MCTRKGVQKISGSFVDLVAQAHYLFLVLFKKLINLFLPALGLRCCARAFSSCSEQGLLFVAVRGLLIAVASLVAEHRLQYAGFSSCGARVQLLRGMRSSRTRNQTCVPCIGRWILNHCATREVPLFLFKLMVIRFHPRYSTKTILVEATIGQLSFLILAKLISSI